ncbi:MAG: tetratricopeptide repeat protein, partial [Spirochaetia bacterium]|nr:tetratricopeptide repeat protein [Spirochaetia bacterium]
MGRDLEYKKIAAIIGILAILLLGAYEIKKSFFSDEIPADALAEEIDQYIDAIADDPGNFSHYMSLAELYSMNKRYEEAVRTIKKALSIDGLTDEEKYRAYIALSEAYLALGDSDMAHDMASRARRVDPNRATAYNRRGQSNEMKGQDDDAMREYDRAEKVDKKDPESYMRKSQLLSKKGKQKEAVKIL